MATTWNISIQGEGTPLDGIQPRTVRFIDALGAAGIPVSNATITSYTAVVLAPLPSGPAADVLLVPAGGATTVVDLTPPKKGKKTV